MENSTPTKFDTLTCLLTVGFEGRRMGWVIRKGNNAFVANFKGRNAYARAVKAYDKLSAELVAARPN